MLRTKTSSRQEQWQGERILDFSLPVSKLKFYPYSQLVCIGKAG